MPGSPAPDLAPPLFVPAPLNDRLWHLGFKQIDTPSRLTIPVLAIGGGPDQDAPGADDVPGSVPRCDGIARRGSRSPLTDGLGTEP